LTIAPSAFTTVKTAIFVGPTWRKAPPCPALSERAPAKRPAPRARYRRFGYERRRAAYLMLAPALVHLVWWIGIPTVATLPMWWQHGLPEEDGVFDDRSTAAGAVTKTIAVVAYRRISNLDEFQPLKNMPGVRLLWARSPADLAQADWIILPGSKHTSSDLAWLRAQGLDHAIAQHAERGGAVLGICGGLQMLGEALIDTHGIDGNAPGLGLLPLVTVFEPVKTVKRTQAQFDTVAGTWAALSDVTTQGYEIHHGQTSQHPSMAAARPVMSDGLAWQNEQGNVLGVYLHGLFEDPGVVHALFGAVAPTLDDVFDGLADFIDGHFARSVIPDLIRDPLDRKSVV
jgi:adenosylcobyric acid synthase